MTQYLTPEGLEKIKRELDHRKNELRGEIANKIKAAKEYGDLSENAEYEEAKEMQNFNESRIEELEMILKDALVIAKERKFDTVRAGATVKVSSKYGEQSFTIVGPSESNPAQGFISNESPLGKAFIGAKKGDEIEVDTPRGKVSYEILDIY